ncbi:MAG: hypothetical protein JW765_07375 [Deltaproteobacteria bacterium]|nr:hypothetical protein [Candidatus Zymogenaceae bacterium]
MNNDSVTEKSRTTKRNNAAMAMHFFPMMFARLFFVMAFALVLAFAVVWLWNWLMPGLFGLGPITYWQAFGLMVLARLVLGTIGPGSWGYRPYDKRTWGDRFKYHRYSCGDMHNGKDFNGTMKWWHNYKRFWRDEGKAAFDEYMKRATDEESKDKTDKK